VELYENNFERRVWYVVPAVGDRAETEDLTSEVFHHALANCKSSSGADSACRLAVRIAANLISDRWQRSSREQLVEAPEQIESAQAKNEDFEEMERRATTVPLWWIRRRTQKQRNSPVGSGSV